MKKYLVLFVLLAAAYYYYRQGALPGLNFQAGTPTLEPLRPSATHDFSAVSASLQQEINNLPANLTGDAPRPVHALDVKRKLHPHLNEHSEYQTLTQVCDLIIQAEAERSALQQSAHAEQRRTTFHSALDPVDKKHPAAASNPTNEQSAIQQRMESTWGDYRAKTTTEVNRLLETLQGKTI